MNLLQYATMRTRRFKFAVIVNKDESVSGFNLKVQTVFLSSKLLVLNSG